MPVYIDHGDRVLVAAKSAMGGIALRLFSPDGFSEIVLVAHEMGPLVELLQTAVAEDAQKRLDNKEPAAPIGTVVPAGPFLGSTQP